MKKAIFLDFYGTVVHEDGENFRIQRAIEYQSKGAYSVGIDTIWINRNNKQVPKGVLSVGNLLEVFDTDFFR